MSEMVCPRCRGGFTEELYMNRLECPWCGFMEGEGAHNGWLEYWVE